MTEKLLLCTDLDRTLIPNGSQPESSGARQVFAHLAGHSLVSLAYVSGRDRRLVKQAIADYKLPPPDFVIADVGTTIYSVAGQNWAADQAWSARLTEDWRDSSGAALAALLGDLPQLEAQEASRQGPFKLSYYAPADSDRPALLAAVRERLAVAGLNARLIWSVDETTATGLLDILPASASKYHAIAALQQQQGFADRQTVFCGDSGNDIEVLVSPVPSVLVANSVPEVQREARQLAEAAGTARQLYLARGGFHGMNGNYAGGILEGIAHYHPEAVSWMGLGATR